VPPTQPKDLLFESGPNRRSFDSLRSLRMTVLCRKALLVLINQTFCYLFGTKRRGIAYREKAEGIFLAEPECARPKRADLRPRSIWRNRRPANA